MAGLLWPFLRTSLGASPSSAILRSLFSGLSGVNALATDTQALVGTCGVDGATLFTARPAPSCFSPWPLRWAKVTTIDFQTFRARAFDVAFTIEAHYAHWHTGTTQTTRLEHAQNMLVIYREHVKNMRLGVDQGSGWPQKQGNAG